MTRRAWSLSDDHKAVGTLMITVRPCPLPHLARRVAPSKQVTRVHKGLCRGPGPWSRCGDPRSRDPSWHSSKGSCSRWWPVALPARAPAEHVPAQYRPVGRLRLEGTTCAASAASRDWSVSPSAPETGASPVCDDHSEQAGRTDQGPILRPSACSVSSASQCPVVAEDVDAAGVVDGVDDPVAHPVRG